MIQDFLIQYSPRIVYRFDLIWPFVSIFLHTTVAFFTSIHIILTKRDARSAAFWVGFLWLVPFLGVILYIFLGINRLQRRAASYCNFKGAPSDKFDPDPHHRELTNLLPQERKNLISLANFVDRTTTRRLLKGNSIWVLENGDQAFPKMLEAIGQAKETISMSSYLFDHDEIGIQFVESLLKAKNKGVQVRVLLDAVGIRYSKPRITKLLKNQKIPFALFNPKFFSFQKPYMNLRNHKKVLILDGKEGFTGGMNIHKRNLIDENPKHPVKDLHFFIKGPVVSHLQENFATDWCYSTGEILQGTTWFPKIQGEGKIFARGINDGPDEDFWAMAWTLLGALHNAVESIVIVTPYFVPPPSILTAIRTAAKSGVKIDLIFPENNNLKTVKWASMALLDYLAEEKNIQIWLTQGPFDHTKLMIVDHTWIMLGSGNWDMRSLRLNFEFNVECYDQKFAENLEKIVDKKLNNARKLTLNELLGRNLPTKIRDNIAKLFFPTL